MSHALATVRHRARRARVTQKTKNSKLFRWWELEPGGDCRHRVAHEGDMLVKVDAELFDAAVHVVAVDELTGFLTACALVRPDKAIAEVKVKSVKKKLKDKAFARGVNRDDVRHGVEELGVDLDEHIAFVRDAMATIADQLELPPPE